MRRPVLGVLFGGCGLGANPGGLSEFCRILVIESEYPYVLADGERNWVRASRRARHSTTGSSAACARRGRNQFLGWHLIGRRGLSRQRQF